MAPPDRRFCGQCGASLWEKCLQCATVGKASERFCGVCGANREATVEQKARDFDRQIHEAESLLAEFRYEEALAILIPVAEADHPRLQAQAQRANQLIGQATAERDRAREHAESTYREAQRLANQANYQAAIELLQHVPLPMRTEAVGQLLEEMASRLEEIALLESRLQEAANAKRPEALLAHVRRLLELKPDHQHARSLAGKFRERLLALASDRLAKHRYQDAVKFLDQVPGPVRDARWDDMNRRASELVCLERAVRDAPVVDRALLALVERWRKLSRGDPAAEAAAEELRRRANGAPADASHAAVAWAAPPEEPYLGYSVDWLTRFQRIALAEEFDRSPLVERPGCFCVAAGLALQGLGKAVMETNLLPVDRGLRGAVGQLWRMRPVRAAWGLDLGSSALKAVRLALEASEQSATVEACDFIEHRKPLSQTVNPDEEKALIEETLRTFLARNEVRSSRICLGLPARMVLLRPMKLPPADEDKMARLLHYEVRRQFPFPLDELVWSYELLQVPRTLDARELPIALVATRRLPLKDRLGKLEALGLKVDIVQSDCFALCNFLAYEFYPPEEPSLPESAPKHESAIALVDVGSDSTTLVVGSPTLAWFHTCGLGSYTLTRMLVQEFNLTVAQAEQLKRNPAAADRFDLANAVMESFFEEVAKEIRMGLSLFAKTHPGQSIDRVFGLGGGFQAHGLLRHLRLGSGPPVASLCHMERDHL